MACLEADCRTTDEQGPMGTTFFFKVMGTTLVVHTKIEHDIYIYLRDYQYFYRLISNTNNIGSTQ